MEQIYNKLVRDKIPEIIESNGEKPIFRILSDEEYKVELENKSLEEYNEVLKANDSNERVEELADMLEIIIALAKIEDKSLDDIIAIANMKREKRGGFDKKIFLEKVI